LEGAQILALQVEDLNAFIRGFPSVIFVSKSPELWKCVRPITKTICDEATEICDEAKEIC